MKLKHPSSLFPRFGLAATVAIAAAMSMSPALAGSPDLDGDGITNRADRDVDGDGIHNGKDRNVDGGVCRKGRLKGKYVGDRLKNDDSGEEDIDDDGLADDSSRELDIDGDGLKDDSPAEKDIDGDGHKDHVDDDIDGDSSRNDDDDDCDGDGRERGRDDDDDGDEVDDDRDRDDDNDGLKDDDELEVEVSLAATASAPAGSRVRAKIKRLPSGKIELEFDGRGLDAGSYDVVINSQVLGQLVMKDDGKRTEGEVEFETNPNKADELPLPFDPIGLSVEIVKDGTSYFNGTVPDPGDATTGGGDDDDDDGGGTPVSVNLLAAPGLSSEAEGEVELKFGTSGVTGFEVEVEAIPAGDYDLFVGGVNRGTLSVTLIKGKLRGKLRYEVVPDGDGELLLGFGVAGESIVISQSGTTFFSGTAPAAP